MLCISFFSTSAHNTGSILQESRLIRKVALNESRDRKYIHRPLQSPGFFMEALERRLGLNTSITYIHVRTYVHISTTPLQCLINPRFRHPYRRGNGRSKTTGPSRLVGVLRLGGGASHCITSIATDWTRTRRKYLLAARLSFRSVGS